MTVLIGFTRVHFCIVCVHRIVAQFCRRLVDKLFSSNKAVDFPIYLGWLESVTSVTNIVIRAFINSDLRTWIYFWFWSGAIIGSSCWHSELSNWSPNWVKLRILRKIQRSMGFMGSSTRSSCIPQMCWMWVSYEYILVSIMYSICLFD